MSFKLSYILDQASRDRGIDKSVIIEALESTMLNVAKKHFGPNRIMEVHYQEETGEFELFLFKTVVNRISNPDTDIDINAARELDSDASLGDSLGVKLDLISVIFDDNTTWALLTIQSAKRLIIEKIKEAKRSAISEGAFVKGEILTGKIKRFDNGNIIVDLGSNEAVLPQEEQIAGESYKHGAMIKGVILDINNNGSVPHIVLSRTHPDFVVNLFQKGIAELGNGVVEIKGVTREPGVRTKIDVKSHSLDIDPVGVCAGMKNFTVRAVKADQEGSYIEVTGKIDELNDEKINIVRWLGDQVVPTRNFGVNSRNTSVKNVNGIAHHEITSSNNFRSEVIGIPNMPMSKKNEMFSLLTEQALSKVRQKLLDLTRRNRLLNYKESARSIRVIDELPDEVFRLLVTEGKSMEVVPIPEPPEAKEGQEQPYTAQEAVNRTNELPDPSQKHKRYQDTLLQTPFTPQLLERRCKRLLQESRTAIEETGSNLLYLAIGFLEWYESNDSTEINRAPLILLPVQLERLRIDKDTNCYTYAISYNEEDIETNISLAEKLSHDFDLILPEYEEETTPESYLDEARKMIGNKSRWRVAREMVLGLFSFSKILMYKDLDNEKWPDNAKIAEHKNITQILVGKDPEEQGEEQIYGEEYRIDADSAYHKIPLILDTDSSQHSAIIDALLKQENLVIEGPPGTGKSQTITNLIAAALNEGKSVLFVAEKKAALEVVRSRLDHAGLGDFCLELHSHKTQKGQLHFDLAKRISRQFGDAYNLSSDQQALTQVRDKLLAYSNLVNMAVGDDGKTIYDIFWAAERWRTEIPACVGFVVENALKLQQQEIDSRVEILKDLARLRTELPDTAIKAWQWFKPAFIFADDEQKINALITSFLADIGRYRAFLGGEGGSVPIDLSIAFLRQLTLANLDILGQKPSDFNEHVGLKFMDSKNIEIVSGLYSSIEEYRRLMSAAERVTKGIEALSVETMKSLNDAASAVGRIWYKGNTPAELAEFVSLLVSAAEALHDIENLSDAANCVLPEPPVKISDLLYVVNIADVIKKAPEDIALNHHPDYFLDLSLPTYEAARQKCEELSARMAEQAKFFNARYLPGYPEILKNAQVLRKYKSNIFAFLFSEYRSVKLHIKGFLLEPRYFKAPDIEVRLEQLADILKEIEEVNNNPDYKRLLGPKYCGTNTKWAWMEHHISWCQEFRRVIRSQSLTHSLMQNYSDIKEKALSTSETLQARWNLASDVLDKVKIAVSVDLQPKQLIDTINNSHKAIKDALTVLSRHESLRNIDITTIKGCAEAYLSAGNLSRTVENDRRFVDLLGTVFFRGIETDTQSLFRTAKWVTDLQEQVRFPKQIIKWLLESDTDRKATVLKESVYAARTLMEKFDSMRSEINSFNDKDVLSWSDEALLTLGEIEDTINACIGSIQYLVTWADYCRSCKKADDLGITAIIDALEEKHITPDICVPLYLFSVYESMARELIRLHPELASFTRASYENVKTSFSELDMKIMRAAREHIGCNTAKRRIPGGVGWGPVRGWTEFNLLAHELQKKKRHIPIRQLVRRAGNSLKALKPCFMMSPMSVAQYLHPGEIEFDMVIMDEASQLRPEDALGALSRAKQLVVVGDPNQLPPSTFFERIDGDSEEDEDETAIQNTESVLDICLSMYKKRRLRWHYRSEHESLIAFSNHQFYDDDLIIFPSPQSNRGYHGVRRHFVEGATYLKGRNKVEADAVALAVANHFRNHPEMSLGVATFNREQSDLIQDALERLQKEQSWLDRKIKETELSVEPFFIKNLENVQGDERDVIFVSTTYGPDPTTGNVFQRFGPIARETGWRRLNVIFTRAKKRLELFTSLRSSEIKLPERPSRGVQSLRAYLEYAETGVLPSMAHVTGRLPDSDFEIAVSRTLQSYGYQVVPQIGVAGFFIDLGVKHPEREWEYILGIECDGAAYHSAKSVRDRDRLRQEILEKKGWKIHRIWSTDWFKNREKEIHRLINTLKALHQKDKTKIVFDDRKLSSEKAFITSNMQNQRTAVEDDKTLREELDDYNEANISISFPDKTTGILREEMLELFLKKKPTSMAEFYSVFPMELRQKTDSKQLQFLKDIFEIIQGYSD